MTVKELRLILKDLPDDYPVCVLQRRWMPDIRKTISLYVAVGHAEVTHNDASGENLVQLHLKGDSE